MSAIRSYYARLEPEMQQAIKRGQILREILKQERLSPMSVEGHMAWLVAFNDGLFDALSLEEVPALLGVITSYSIHYTKLYEQQSPFIVCQMGLPVQRQRW